MPLCTRSSFAKGSRFIFSPRRFEKRQGSGLLACAVNFSRNITCINAWLQCRDKAVESRCEPEEDVCDSATGSAYGEMRSSSLAAQSARRQETR
jgi:hypothetical protein